MLAVAVVVIVVWALVFFAIMRDRRSGIPVPPNLKPYLEDDALETGHLERVLQVAVVLLVFTSIGLAAIFIWEPTRQAEAFDDLSEKAVETGAVIYASTQPDAEGHTNPKSFGCADCHGPGGVGGSAPQTITDDNGKTRQVAWAAPPLNTILLRFSEDEVRQIIMFGRPGTPMPPWAVEGGGAMNPQQIENVLAYLTSIQITPEEAIEENAGVSGGAELFDMNCASCHTAGYSYGEGRYPGDGALGPGLRGGVSLIRFPLIDDQVEFISEGSKFSTAYGNQGMGTGRMPGFAQMLTAAQILAIVEYERNGLPNDDRISSPVEATSVSEGGINPANPNDATQQENFDLQDN